jgi:flagellar assembly protein FliH
VLASLAARSAAGVRIVRGAAAAGATMSPFTAVEDLDEPLTDDELTARLTPGERLRREELAERGYEEGRAEGRRDGYEAGRAEALHELAAHAASSVSALQQAVQALQQRDAVALDELDDQVAGFALDLVATILDRELATSSDPGRDAIARALAFVPDRGNIVARLHPDDLALLGSVTDLAPGRDIELVPDAGIERGGCTVDVGACRIDAQLSPAMARVADVLSGIER